MNRVFFVGAASAAALWTSTSALAQDAPAAVPAPTPVVAPPPAPAKTKIPEGTEVLVRFEDRLSSATNRGGDQFSIRLDDDITLSDGTIVRSGYRGRGEVTDAEKRGMMGRAGTLNVRLNYIRVGDTRVRLRGNKGGEGKGAVGATVALTVLFGPLGLIKRGHDIEITPGQTITAYVDDDAEIQLPLTPPPAD